MSSKSELALANRGCGRGYDRAIEPLPYLKSNFFVSILVFRRVHKFSTFQKTIIQQTMKMQCRVTAAYANFIKC